MFAKIKWLKLKNYLLNNPKTPLQYSKAPYIETKTIGKKKYEITHLTDSKNPQTVQINIDTSEPPKCTLIMPYLTYDGDKHAHHRFDIRAPVREMPSDKRSLIVLNESVPKVHLITIPPNKRCKYWVIQLKRWHNGKVYDNEKTVTCHQAIPLR